MGVTDASPRTRLVFCCSKRNGGSRTAGRPCLLPMSVANGGVHLNVSLTRLCGRLTACPIGNTCMFLSTYFDNNCGDTTPLLTRGKMHMIPGMKLPRNGALDFSSDDNSRASDICRSGGRNCCACFLVGAVGSTGKGLSVGRLFRGADTTIGGTATVVNGVRRPRYVISPA